MKWWRQMWDISYSFSSALLAVLLGLVLGNVLQGMPLDSHHEFTGHWTSFLNPYAIMVGIVTLALFAMHGGIYLSMKTEGRLFAKVTMLIKRAMILFITTFGLVTLYTLIYFPHLSNKFKDQPLLFVVPVFAFLSIANIPSL